MSKAQGLFILVATIGLAGCETPGKPPEMLGTTPAAIGLSVGIDSAFQNQKPNAAYFVKLGDRNNVLSVYPVIRSNYVNGYHVYLLNAEPGLYAVVAASYSQFMPAPPPTSGGVSVTVSGGTIGRVAYFSEDVIRKTIVEVKPGSISYMGTYEIDMAAMAGFRAADRAQTHYRSQMQTGLASTFESKEKKSVRDAESEKEFLQKARQDFAESDWRRVIP
jgi:hypothetical protein